MTASHAAGDVTGWGAVTEVLTRPAPFSTIDGSLVGQTGLA